MFRSSLMFLFVICLHSAVALSQDQPPKPDLGRIHREMTWTLTGTGGYIGVHTKDVSAENYASFGLPSVRGVAVEKVAEGSPAEKAGLQAGDVILRFNGEEVTSGRKLTRLVGEVAPDHTVRLTVFRNGAETEISVTVGKRTGRESALWNFPLEKPDGSKTFEFRFPAPGEFKSLETFPMPQVDGDVFVWRSAGSRQIGIGITPLTKQLAEHFGVEKGVMINNVREGSPAERSGLRAGDIIIEIDGKEIASEMEVIRSISGKREGDVMITVMRQGSRQTFTVTPETAPAKPSQSLEHNFEPLSPVAPGWLRPERVI